MVVQATGANNKLILSSEDIGNFRLTSRHYNHHALDAWARRFFTTRKHMLSRRSVQCLIDIARDPILSHHVREVAICSERINPKLMLSFDKLPRDRWGEWKRHYSRKWRELLQGQDAFEASGDMTPMLKDALNGFDSLQHICVHSNSSDWRNIDDSGDGAPWIQTWGTRSILRQIGMAESRWSDWPRPHHVFIDFVDHGHRIHGYYDEIFSTLCFIREKNWTLHLDCSDMWAWRQGPFDLTSPYWNKIRDRVRSIGLQTVISTGERTTYTPWIRQFIQACPGLKLLSLNDECSDASFLDEFDDTELVSLSIRKSMLPSWTFARFLAKHANTLECIVCEDLGLDDGWEIVDDAEPVSNSEWFSILEMMTKMSRLRTVQFEKLRQKYDRDSKTSKFCPGDDELERLGGQTGINAIGDVAGKLGRTIGEKVLVDDEFVAEIRYEVCFM